MAIGGLVSTIISKYEGNRVSSFCAQGRPGAQTTGGQLNKLKETVEEGGLGMNPNTMARGLAGDGVQVILALCYRGMVLVSVWEQ